MDLLQLENVWKSYMGQQILRGVDLAVGYGELVVIRGRSGAGKTTLLKIIAMLLRPDGGRVIYKGVDVWSSGDSVREELRKTIAYIPQFLELLPQLTVYDNIALPLFARGVSRSLAMERVEAVARELGLKNYLTRYPDTLSGGERQRVAIARALVSDPTLLVADEPTAHLDDEAAEEFYRLLFDVRRSRGFTVVVATTELQASIPGASTVYILERGRLNRVH